MDFYTQFSKYEPDVLFNIFSPDAEEAMCVRAKRIQGRLDSIVITTFKRKAIGLSAYYSLADKQEYQRYSFEMQMIAHLLSTVAKAAGYKAFFERYKEVRDKKGIDVPVLTYFPVTNSYELRAGGRK